MKDLVVSEDIIPIGEFKKQASRLCRRVKETNRPILVTQNGSPVGVIISPVEYDRMMESVRLIKGVKEGLQQSEAGQVLTSEELDKELDREFGPLDNSEKE